jgi:undecaprenyl-diphosphatase
MSSRAITWPAAYSGSGPVDFDLYQQLNGFSLHHDWFEDLNSFLAMQGHLFFIALLAALFLGRGKFASRSARHGVIAAGLAAALALAVAHGISLLWERPRPYIAHPNDAHLFIPASSDSSFPSDHATAAFAISVSLFLRSTRVGLAAIAMAAALAFSRVAVGIHYPSDVVAGAIIGTAVALVLWLPPMRGHLHSLADWAGSRYERMVDVALRPFLTTVSKGHKAGAL